MDLDYSTSKAFAIGVGIFVTLIIVSSFILMLNVVADIYNATENTNTSITAQFDNVYSMYAGAKLNTLNLMNTLRKYETDELVRIGVKFKADDEVIYGQSNSLLLGDINDRVSRGELGYEEMFDVSVFENGIYIQIIFSKK